MLAPGHYNNLIIKFFKFPNYCLWRTTSLDTFGQFYGSNLVSVLFQGLIGFVYMVLNNLFALCSKLGSFLYIKLQYVRLVLFST